jgi:uncharacterized protein
MAIALNETKATELAAEVRVARSVWARFWGLMGRRELPPGHGLLISPCSSVHTFFMRFPIDVIYLDRAGRVVKVVDGMKPWRMDLGGSGAHSVLELNAGVTAGRSLEVGDLLAFPER